MSFYVNLLSVPFGPFLDDRVNPILNPVVEKFNSTTYFYCKMITWL